MMVFLRHCLCIMMSHGRRWQKIERGAVLFSASLLLPTFPTVQWTIVWGFFGWLITAIEKKAIPISQENNCSLGKRRKAVKNKTALNASLVSVYDVVDWGNLMTSKMLDWKIKPDLTHVKIIQHDTARGVLDSFYTSKEAWIFNPTFFQSLD